MDNFPWKFIAICLGVAALIGIPILLESRQESDGTVEKAQEPQKSVQYMEVHHGVVSEEFKLLHEEMQELTELIKMWIQEEMRCGDEERRKHLNGVLAEFNAAERRSEAESLSESASGGSAKP